MDDRSINEETDHPTIWFEIDSQATDSGHNGPDAEFGHSGDSRAPSMLPQFKKKRDKLLVLRAPTEIRNSAMCVKSKNMYNAFISQRGDGLTFGGFIHQSIILRSAPMESPRVAHGRFDLLGRPL